MKKNDYFSLENKRNHSTLEEKKLFLEERLKESGEEVRLENYLRQKLIEAGWKDQLKNHCKALIRAKGLEKITIEDLIEELSVKAKNLVPVQLKEEILSKIKIYFEDEGLI